MPVKSGPFSWAVLVLSVNIRAKVIDLQISGVPIEITDLVVNLELTMSSTLNLSTSEPSATEWCSVAPEVP